MKRVGRLFCGRKIFTVLTKRKWFLKPVQPPFRITSYNVCYTKLLRTFAASNLPEKAGERFVGAATADAANTLLGKVYLTLGDKTSAATALMKVYGNFDLVPYADLWDLTKKNGAESIFEIQYMGGIS